MKEINPLFEVIADAVRETRDKVPRYWKDPDMALVHFALGLFSGVLLRRMNGEPDPDKEEG